MQVVSVEVVDTVVMVLGAVVVMRQAVVVLVCVCDKMISVLVV